MKKNGFKNKTLKPIIHHWILKSLPKNGRP